MKPWVLTGIGVCLAIASVQAQINRTNNKDLILAHEVENTHQDAALKTGESFFELARTNQRTEWEKLLSKSCFTDSLDLIKINGWYHALSEPGSQFKILYEDSAPRTDQKRFVYACKKKGKQAKKHSLILVREDRKWRIYHLSL